MKADEAAGIIWDSMREGIHYPEALKGKLKLEDANEIQFKVLEHWINAGEKQAGWKIGITNDPLRRAFNLDAPIFGYLLESRKFSSGVAFQHDGIPNPAIEAELYFTMSERLEGPGATKEQARDAVALVAPAFELVSVRGNMAADIALAVADNINQWGYVTGEAISPYPKDLDLGEIVADIKTNDSEFFKGRGSEVIDNQLASLAWLANQLAKYGRALEAGHCIMSGSFIKPTPIARGDRWQTHFSSIGSVSAGFD